MVACLMSSSSIGILLNTVGIFNVPVSRDIGVSLGDFSFVSTLSMLALSVTALFIPRLLKRFAFKRIVFVSTFVSVATSILFAHASKLWQFYLLGTLRGAFMALLAMVTLTILINNWFKTKHGFVTGLVFSFSGVAGALVSPLLQYFVQTFGWRSAYYLTAALVFALNLPALLVPFSLDPRDEGLLPYGASESDENHESKTPVAPLQYMEITFLAFLVISFLNTTIAGITQHLPAIGEHATLTAMQGASMLSASMLGNILSKLLIGILSDKRGALFSNVFMTAVNLFSLLLLLTSDHYCSDAGQFSVWLDLCHVVGWLCLFNAHFFCS